MFLTKVDLSNVTEVPYMQKKNVMEYAAVKQCNRSSHSGHVDKKLPLDTGLTIKCIWVKFHFVWQSLSTEPKAQEQHLDSDLNGTEP